MQNFSPIGILNVFKPPGPTSSDIVVSARRLLDVKKIGHLGTLDPGAAGVLPLCLGTATRLFDYLVEKKKTYIAEIVFGAATDSHDAFGRVTARGESAVNPETLADALQQFTGELTQTPSAFSALKSGGKRQYELARSGEALALKERKLTIDEFSVLEQTAENKYLLKVTCSRGTYVRTLINDIGAACAVPAHMGFLLRTQNGIFSIDTALTLEEIGQASAKGRLGELLVNVESVLLDLPAARVGSGRKEPMLNGLSTNVEFVALERSIHEGEPFRLYCDGEFLGIGKLREQEIKLAVRLK